MAEQEKQLLNSATSAEDLANAHKHSSRLEKKFNIMKAMEGVSLNGNQKQMRPSYTISELNSDDGIEGKNPLIEIYPKARCEDIEDYNQKGTLDSLFLA